MPYERSLEQTKRLARWSGAVYLLLGVATLFGFFHAPLVQVDLGAVTRAITGPQRIALYERVTMLARAAGELPIILWLLIKGADAHRTSS